MRVSIGRRSVVAGALAFAAAPLAARAQQVHERRIAYLSANPPGDWRVEAFREGLSSFGYVEGRDVAIDSLFAPSTADLPQFAVQAVAGKPDIVIAINAAAAVAAKRATTAIPIVFTALSDPVGSGVVSSLARPAG